jgi:hypothetical protein
MFGPPVRKQIAALPAQELLLTSSAAAMQIESARMRAAEFRSDQKEELTLRHQVPEEK